MDQPSQITADAPRLRDRARVPIFLLISLVGALFAPFTAGAYVILFAAGGTLFWLGASRRLPRRGSPAILPANAYWWLAPALLLGVFELVDLAMGSTYDHPTLSKLAEPLMAQYPVRVAAYLGWLQGFWALARR